MTRDSFVKRTAVAIVAVCTLVVCGTVAVGAARIYLRKPAAAYLPGQQVDLPASVYNGARRTLVIIGRAGCSACQRAAPEYARLARYLKTSGHDVRTVLVTAVTDLDRERGFAEQLGVSAHHLADLSALRVRVVPTVLVLDSHGTVLLAQESQTADADRLLEAIAQPGAGR